jgi:hypothetical protein
MELHLHSLMFVSGVVRGGKTTLVESVLGLCKGLGGLDFESRRGREVYHFSKSSTLLWGPTHPHTQWVPALFDMTYI